MLGLLGWHALTLCGAREIDYNRDVRPILSENCFSCHGPDEKSRKGKLRLDLAESAYAERNGIVRLKPGDLENSARMSKSGKRLDDEVHALVPLQTPKICK